MDFHINQFQYFDQKLFDKNVEIPNEFSFEELLQKRKIEFKQHYFIVTCNNRVLMMDSYLLNYIKLDSDKQQLHFHISEQVNKPIYWIEIHNHKNNIVSVDIAENIEQVILHEDIILEKSHTYMHINNYGKLDYINMNHSYTENVFHKELEIDNYGLLKGCFMQKESSSFIKLDSQIRLFENASSSVSIFTLIQSKQLRDDCFEIQHISPNTYSDFSYQSLNNGKAVSQVNNIIEKKSLNSQLNQSIKHILLSADSQSFSKPNLMIHAPTIAAHGNTMSSFPEDWLFYLYQKGLTKIKAQQIIKESMIKNFCSHTNYEEQFYSYFIGDLYA